MRQQAQYIFLILSLYGSILMALAAFFLVSEPLLLENLHYYNLPLGFLMRFSVFWFCSFLFSLIFVLFYMRHQAHVIPEFEKRQALRFGAYAFSLGTVAAVVVASLFFLVNA